MSGLTAAIAGLPADEAAFALAGCATLGLIGAFLWWSGLKNGRLMADTPTSRIRSAAQGFVELKGTVHWLPDDRIHAPLSGQSCVWWEYRIEERQRRHTSKGVQYKWVRIAGARSEELFLLQDGTGDAVVDPHGAKITASTRQSWRGGTPRPTGGPGGHFDSMFGRYRYVESRLSVGTHVYSLGALRTETAELDTHDHRREVSEWLRALKTDQQRLLKQYDANRDGQISAEEWEVARQHAIAAIDAELLQRSLAPGVHVLERPRDGRPFLLSAKSESQLLRRFRWKAGAGFVLAIAGLTGTLLIAQIRGWIPG